LVAEIGPSVLLNDGRVFVVGATGSTALYIPPADPAQPGTWTAGPQLLDAQGTLMFPMDAPAALLPNGRVLLTGSPAPPCSYPPPTTFFEYDPTSNRVTPITPPGNSSESCYVGRFMLLPTGKVLFSNNSSSVWVYTPDGQPNAAWRPQITACSASLRPGQTYPLSGRQLNGLSQAVYYGDDATMATNYPLVRIRNRRTSRVACCRTHDHSTMGVATGSAVHSTRFDVPLSIDLGDSDLTVVANGISSDSLTVNVN
jgi:hypothetical protein